jgi:phosphoribosyl 1,2-cyclic phosphodiesterase
MPDQGESPEEVLGRAMSPPHFPIVPKQLGGGWSFTGLAEGSHEIEGYRVLAREIPHKGGCTLGYRVERAGGSFAYLSDHSPTTLGPGPDGWGERHDAAMDLADGVDLLIHDAQHLGREFPGVGFLGHASIEYAVALAREAGVRTLALFHHSPWRTDEEVDEIVVLARRLAAGGPAVLAAYEGLVLDLPGATTG